MKKQLRSVFMIGLNKAAFFCLSLILTSTITQGQVHNNPANQSKELIADRRFKQKFYTHRIHETLYTDTIGCPMNVSSSPIWRVAEFGSNSSFLNMQPQPNNVMCKFANNYKDFRFGGPIGAQEYDIYFAVNSETEYGGIHRVDTMPWPHLLVEQQLSPSREVSTIAGPGCPWLSITKSLNFKIDAKLYNNLTIKGGAYNNQLHAGQFFIYFIVQNLNPADSGYSDFIWLGIPLYDDREPFVADQPHLDGQTGKWIYSIPFNNLSSISLHSGSWVSLNVDILPAVTDALKDAWSKGRLKGSERLADYKIGTINMGWELPGMNISTMVVKNLSLVANTNQLFWGPEEGNTPGAGLVAPTTVFPNPVEENTVNFSGEKIQTISITNCLGQVVIHQKNNTTQSETVNVNISTLPSGVYFSTIQTENGIEKIKFLKK